MVGLPGQKAQASAFSVDVTAGLVTLATTLVGTAAWIVVGGQYAHEPASAPRAKDTDFNEPIGATVGLVGLTVRTELTIEDVAEEQ